MTPSASRETPTLGEESRATKSPESLTFISYRAPMMKHSGPRKRKRGWTHSANQGPTASKIRNACITCREKKTRCSGHQPCIRCEQNGQSCRYMPTVSTQALEGTQPQRNLNASPTLSIVSANTTPFQLPQFPGDCGHGGSQGHHGHSRGASSSSVTNPDAPDESLQEDKNGRIHGGASEFAFMQLAKKRLANLPAMSIDFPDDPLPCPAGLAAVLPPKDIADQLTARYFEFGLSTSRLVHKPSLIHIVDKIYSGEECRPDDLALAYIVLALGSHYSDHTSPFCGYSASVRFYDVAHAQLEETPDLITLATSQTRLLIIHFLLNHARMHEAWSAFGIVVRHVQALGLHRRSRPADADCIGYEYRKRLFWCVYINDRILSSMFGRPLAIHDDDIDQDECALANDEDIDESKCKLTKDGLFCSSAGLVHYARIARILGQILRGFYTPASRLQDVSQLHASATVFEKGLRDWEDGLPPYLNYIVLPPSAVSVTAQRQMCTLKLMSAHASLLLYRPFILHAINRNAEQTPNLQWIKTCHEKCIEAAKTVVSECHYLSQRGLFSRTFWLVTYMQFASIGTLLTYSYLWPEDITARKTAEDAMAEFPAGIDGDPVGQRYLATLKELREMTVRARDGSYRGRPLIFDSSPEAQIEVLGNESSDQGQWTNFFDASLLDEMVVGYNTNG